MDPIPWGRITDEGSAYSKQYLSDGHILPDVKVEILHVPVKKSNTSYKKIYLLLTSSPEAESKSRSLNILVSNSQTQISLKSFKSQDLKQWSLHLSKSARECTVLYPLLQCTRNWYIKDIFFPKRFPWEWYVSGQISNQEFKGKTRQVNLVAGYSLLWKKHKNMEMTVWCWEAPYY